MNALEIAAEVQARKVTARALTEAALDRISRYNSAVNAFTTLLTERALAEADALDARIAMA
jgi:aspartyl-tRNA(Asn)/glutamyl-tRNA(Gln) amidotransferase subunit A